MFMSPMDWNFLRGAIRSLSYGETYKYLGVMESCNIDHGLVREKVASEYKHCLKLICDRASENRAYLHIKFA